MSTLEYPDWLVQLMTAVLDCIEDLIDPEGEIHEDHKGLTWRATYGDDGWEAELFPAPILLETDEVYCLEMVMNLTRVAEVFDSGVEVLGGPGAAIVDGSFAGNEIQLIIMWEPPDDAEPMVRRNHDGSMTPLTRVELKPVVN